MATQVLSHTGQVGGHVEAEGSQVVGGPHAGAHQ